jgi:hypothetical protein
MQADEVVFDSGDSDMARRVLDKILPSLQDDPATRAQFWEFAKLPEIPGEQKFIVILFCHPPGTLFWYRVQAVDNKQAVATAINAHEAKKLPDFVGHFVATLGQLETVTALGEA